MKNFLERAARVEVLLATYNGERFLRQQLDSILAQDYPEFVVTASDDGSADGTLQILKEYVQADPTRVRIVDFGPPSGSARNNFLRLMQQSTAQYVCFADQDDVWLPGKLSRSMNAMRALERQEGSAKPLLVFADLKVVDAELQTLHESMWKLSGLDPGNIDRLSRVLGENLVTGCTVLINHPMLLLGRQMPEAATMHDRWLGLLAASLGKADYLTAPTVLYRQHAANVVGATTPTTSVSDLVRRAVHLGGRRAERVLSESQVAALLALHSDQMTEANRKLLVAFLRSGQSRNSSERLWLTLRHGFFRGGALKTLATLIDIAIYRSTAQG